MDKAKLIKAFGLTGVTADSTDDEVQAAIQAKLDKEKADKEAADVIKRAYESPGKCHARYCERQTDPGTTGTI